MIEFIDVTSQNTAKFSLVTSRGLKMRFLQTKNIQFRHQIYEVVCRLRLHHQLHWKTSDSFLGFEWNDESASAAVVNETPVTLDPNNERRYNWMQGRSGANCD